VSNQDIQAARDYHAVTKLAYINLGNKPPLYKVYADGELVALPIPALESVAGTPGGSGLLDITSLARLLYLSAGLVRKRVLPLAGEVHYRAAASAGALYPIEVYLACRDIPGLAAGVYHFSPLDFSLRRLRDGDHRGALLAAAGDTQIAAAPGILVFTAIFWRSAWKYRPRAYRYCLWDCGTMLANLLATAQGEIGLPAKVVAGFVDEAVNGFLGLQQGREAALCLVPVGAGSTHQDFPRDSGEQCAAPDPLPFAPGDAADGVIDYPEIRRIHDASCLAADGEVAAWRAGAAAPGPWRRRETPQNYSPGSAAASPLTTRFPLAKGGASSAPLGQVVLDRRSTRRFSREPIPFSKLSSILDGAAKRLPADFNRPGGEGLVDIYVVANAVEGLPSGAYFFSPQAGELELLKEGAFREEAGHLCFEQALGADASAVLFLMADLERVLAGLGNRGYRAAQLEAGIVVGNAYLCAHSLGLGASGITFYDDEVTAFFSPHAAGKSVMFVVVLGVTHQKNQVRPFRSRVGVMLDALARGASGAARPDKA
jgi:SagB-type dehydrogenase family enzyme